MNKKLSELTVFEILALISVLAKALGSTTADICSVLKSYQSAFENTDESYYTDSNK